MVTLKINHKTLCKNYVDRGIKIVDIIEISSWFNITVFFVTMDIEKAFDSLDHSLLFTVLKKLDF